MWSKCCQVSFRVIRYNFDITNRTFMTIYFIKFLIQAILWFSRNLSFGSYHINHILRMDSWKRGFPGTFLWPVIWFRVQSILLSYHCHRQGTDLNVWKTSDPLSPIFILNSNKSCLKEKILIMTEMLELDMALLMKWQLHVKLMWSSR